MLKKLLIVAMVATTMLSCGVARAGTAVDVKSGDATNIGGVNAFGAANSFDVGVFVNANPQASWTGVTAPHNWDAVTGNQIDLTKSFEITGKTAAAAGTIGIVSYQNASLITNLAGYNVNVTSTDTLNGIFTAGFGYLANANATFTGSVINGGTLTVTAGVKTQNAAGIGFINSDDGKLVDMDGTINVAGIKVDGKTMAGAGYQAVGIGAANMNGTIHVGTIGSTANVIDVSTGAVAANGASADAIGIGLDGNNKAPVAPATKDKMTGTVVVDGNILVKSGDTTNGNGVSGKAIGVAMQGEVTGTGSLIVNGNTVVQSGDAGTGIAGYAEGVSIQGLKNGGPVILGDVSATAGKGVATGGGVTGETSRATGLQIQGANVSASVIQGGTLTATAQASGAIARSLYITNNLASAATFDALVANANGAAFGANFQGGGTTEGISKGGALNVTGDITATSTHATAGVAAGILSVDMKTNPAAPVLKDINGLVNVGGQINSTITNAGWAIGIGGNKVGADGNVLVADTITSKVATGGAFGVTLTDINGAVNTQKVVATVGTGTGTLLGAPVPGGYSAVAVSLNNVNGSVLTGDLEATATTTGSTLGYYSNNIALLGSASLGDVTSKTPAGNATGIITDNILGTMASGDVIADATNAAGTGIGAAQGVLVRTVQGTSQFGNITANANTLAATGMTVWDNTVDVTGPLAVGNITAVSTKNIATSFDANGGINSKVVTGYIDAQGSLGATGFNIDGNVGANGDITIATNDATGLAINAVTAKGIAQGFDTTNIDGKTTIDGGVYVKTGATDGNGAAAGIWVGGNMGANSGLTVNGDVYTEGNDTTIASIDGIGVAGTLAPTAVINTQGVAAVNTAKVNGKGAVGINLAGNDVQKNQLNVAGPVFADAASGEADGILAKRFVDFNATSSIGANSDNANAYGIKATDATQASVINVTGTGDIVATTGSATAEAYGVKLAGGTTDTINFTSDDYQGVFTADGAETYNFVGNTTLDAGSRIDDNAGNGMVANVLNGSSLILDQADVLANVGQVNSQGGAIVANTDQVFNNLSDTADTTGGKITINNGSDVQLNNTIGTTYSGLIEGDGSILKTGVEMTLKGVNTYTGGTVIGTSDVGAVLGAPSSLRIDDVGGVGTGPVTFKDTAGSSNSRLAFALKNSGQFDNLITGQGGIRKTTGSGNTVLTLTNPDNAFNGGVSIGAGTIVATRGGALGGTALARNNTFMNNNTTLVFDIAENNVGDDIYYGDILAVTEGGPFVADNSRNVIKTGAGTLIHACYTNLGGGTWDIQQGNNFGFNEFVDNSTFQVEVGATLGAGGPGENGVIPGTVTPYSTDGSGLFFNTGSILITKPASRLLIGSDDPNPVNVATGSNASQFGTTKANADALNIRVDLGTELDVVDSINNYQKGVFDIDFTSGIIQFNKMTPEQYQAWLDSQEIMDVAQQGWFEYNPDTGETDYTGTAISRDDAWSRFEIPLRANGAGDFLPLVTQDLVYNVWDASKLYNTDLYRNVMGWNDQRWTDLLYSLGRGGSLPDPMGYAGYRYATGQDLANSLEAVQDTVKTFTRAISHRAYNLGSLSRGTVDECGNYVPDCNGYKTRIWAGYSGLWSNASDRGGDRGYKYDAHGFNVGLDHLTSAGVAVGAAFGYSKGDYKLKGGLSDDSNIDNYSFALYTSYNHASGFFTTLIGSYTRSNYDMKNQVGFNAGTKLLPAYRYFTDVADYDSDTWSIGGSIGYDIRPAANFTITPSLGLYYFDTTTNSFDTYSPNGPANANLMRSGMKYSRDSLEMPLDVTVKYDIPFGCDGANKLSLIGNAGYSYNFINKGTKIHGYGMGSGLYYNNPNDSWGRDEGSSTWYVGAGAQLNLNRFDIGVNYEYVGRSNYNSHNLLVNAGVKF